MSSLHKETWTHWLSKMRSVKILIKVRIHRFIAQSVLNLRWVHMSDGALSDVATLIHLGAYHFSGSIFKCNQAGAL